MKVKEFLEKQQLRFPDGHSQIREDDIVDWIKEEGYSETQLDTIDMLIRNGHKGYNNAVPKYPVISQLKDIVKKGYVKSGKEITNDIFYPDKFVRFVCNEEMLDFAAIKKKYGELEKKKFFTEQELNTYENFFLFIFDIIITNYRVRARKINQEINLKKAEQELVSFQEGKPIYSEKVYTEMDIYNKIKSENKNKFVRKEAS
jgi:hypothetical protein